MKKEGGAVCCYCRNADKKMKGRTLYMVITYIGIGQEQSQQILENIWNLAAYADLQYKIDSGCM